MKSLGILCGVGSLLRETEHAGFEVVGNIETRAPYRTGRHLSWDLNYPHVPLITSPTEALPDAFRDVDVAIGHPPCGSHSTLGNSSASRDTMSDTERLAYFAKRNRYVGMLPLFCEYVRTLEPKSFLLDNLPKIMDTSAPPAWWQAQLPDYNLTFIVMLNWDYGTPQLRQRLWVVGVRRPAPAFVFTPPKGGRLDGPTTMLEAFTGLPWLPWEDVADWGHVHVQPHEMLTGDYRTTIPELSVTRATELGLGFLSIPPERAWPYQTRTGRIAVKIGRMRGYTDAKSRVVSGLPSIHHPMTGWPLTPRERARLMSWPDDFHLGNALTPWDRRAQMRLVLFTGKAVPSAFPRYVLPQLRKHLRRHTR